MPQNETPHTGGAALALGRSVWYSWSAPASGDTTVDTCDGDFDTVVAVYTGSDLLRLRPVAGDYDSCNRKGGSFAEFPAQAGTTYKIVVDGHSNATGNFDLHIEGQPTPPPPPPPSPRPQPPPSQPPAPPQPKGASAGNDTLRGTAGADRICGLAGSDVIDGLAGADTLFGDQCGSTSHTTRYFKAAAAGDGNDRLSGGAGNDRL